MAQNVLSYFPYRNGKIFIPLFSGQFMNVKQIQYCSVYEIFGTVCLVFQPNIKKRKLTALF